MDKKQMLVEFGKRLRDAREYAGLSQADLAEKIGSTKSSISTYESGLADPRQSSVPIMAKALDVSVEWLILGRPEDAPGRKQTVVVNISDLTSDQQKAVRDYIDSCRRLNRGD